MFRNKNDGHACVKGGILEEIAMLNILAGKRRRWQKSSDGGRDEKRRRDDISTGRTCLLSSADQSLQTPPYPNPESTVDRSRLLLRVDETLANPNPRPGSASDACILASAGRDGDEEPIALRTLSRNPNPSPNLESYPNLNPRSESSSNRSNFGARDVQKGLDRWASDMDRYLAASRLCREEAMACSLLTEEVELWWAPFVERKNGKKNKKKISSSSKAFNGGQCSSWRGIKKLLSKQFMPFSSSLLRDDPHGMDHLSSTSTRSSRVLTLKTNVVELRKMDARIQDSVNKHAFITGSKRLKAKDSQGLNDSQNRETCSTEAQLYLPSMDSMNSKSRFPSRKENWKLKQSKLKENAIVRKVNTLLTKASNVAVEVCDALNLQ